MMACKVLQIALLISQIDSDGVRGIDKMQHGIEQMRWTS